MKRFSIVNNGYDIGEVNKFIDIVIGRLEKLNAENAKYVLVIQELNDRIKLENNDEKIEKALLAIQNMADRIENSSREEARIIVDEARNNANSIIHEALLKAEKIEQERILLEKNIKLYKARIKSFADTELKIAEELDKLTL